MLIKTCLSIATPAGRGARLSVLIFHRVFATPDPIFPDEMYASRFDEVCGWIKSWFNVLPLDAAVAHLKAGTLPARAACITFDDGYADNHNVALPLLRKHGLPATFFIATGFLDGGRMWNDTVIESVRLSKLTTIDLGELGCYAVNTSLEKAVAIGTLIGKVKYLPTDARLAAVQTIANAAQVSPPNDLMMTSSEVKAMRQAGMQIGAHTVSHPILARLTDEQARAEVKFSKDFLEDLLDERVGLFAYPNGKPGEDYSPRTVAVVRDLGFDAAVSTQWGAARPDADVFQLRRFTPWDKAKFFFGARLLTNML